MKPDLVDIIEADSASDAIVKSDELDRLLGTVLLASQIDQQSDSLTDRMAARIAQIESCVRVAWKARWSARNPANRSIAVEQLDHLKRAREQQRRQYIFGMECVIKLRSKHIESIERTIKHAPDASTANRLLEADFCGSFSILLADGTEVVPFRIRDSARKIRAFKVSDGGNRSTDAKLIYDEDELRRHVELGFRVRCKTRDGTRSGLYTAGSPNRIAEASRPLR